MIKSVVRFAGVSLVLLVLAACAYAPEEPSPLSQVYPFVRLSPSPPPLAQMEIRPPPTQPMREIWRPGYWSYNGQEFKWVAGQYIMRPAPNAAWMPDRWEHRQFGWAFVTGYWQ